MFELAISPNSLKVTGSCTIQEGQSTDHFEEVPEIPAGKAYGPTNYIIQDDQPFNIRFDWEIKGIFAHFLGGGDWKCDVLFEQMGGDEVNYNPSNSTPDLGTPNTKYVVNVKVPQQQLKPGVYRVIARLQYYFSTGRPGPLVAFEDKNVIQIYKDL